MSLYDRVTESYASEARTPTGIFPLPLRRKRGEGEKIDPNQFAEDAALLEVFDRPAGFEWLNTATAARQLNISGGSVEAIAEFHVGDVKFVVWFRERVMPGSYRGIVTIVDFAAVKGVGGKLEVDQQLTGAMGRKALKVIGSVGGVVVEYAKRKSNTEFLGLAAVASEPSRVKLYRRLAPKLAAKLGWAGATEWKDSDAITQVIYKARPPAKKRKKKRAVVEARRPLLTIAEGRYDQGRCTNAVMRAFGICADDAMNTGHILSSLRQAGWKYQPVRLPWDRKARLREFVATHQAGRYVIGVRRHAMALIDGKLTDTMNRGPDGRHLQDVYAVWRAGEPTPTFESYPNRARGQARDLAVPSGGDKQPTEAPTETPEQPLDSPGPGNTNARTQVRAAGSKMHRIREPNAKPAALHRRQITSLPGLP